MRAGTDPLRWVAENAGSIGGCSEGGNFLPKCTTKDYRNRIPSAAWLIIVCMTDRVDKAKRSAMMAAVRSKNTKPELVVRKLAFSLGYRYRLNYKGLLGRPDLVFVGKRKAIFVHGCFWHRHKNCPMASMPQTHASFWRKKFVDNEVRDKRVLDALRESGWKVMIVWQCELRDIKKVTESLKNFLA